MQPKIINTSNYTTDGKVKIDGKEWSVSLPGAGRELQYLKSQRRITLLTTKVEDGTATEEDLDKLDTLEDNLLEFLKSLFKDGTKDNSEVKEWVDNTPISVITAVFEDIKKAAEEKDGSE